MRDKISIPRIALLHPNIRAQVQYLIERAEAGFPETVAIRIVQGLRTFEEQQALYDQGRTKPGNRVTNAKAGSSFHNYGLAFDFAILYDGVLSWDIAKDFDRDGEADWMEVVNIFEEAGYTWGGRFTSLKDNPHIEKSFGFTWKNLLQRHNNKIFISGTTYVQI